MQRSFRATVIAPVLAGVLAASAIAIAGTVGMHAGLTSKAAPRHLRIRGHVVNLVPGRSSIYQVSVRNPLGSAVVVHRVHAEVHRGRTAAGHCPARVLHIRTWKGAQRIQPGTARWFDLSVRLRRAAPDRCQDARWPIHYVARSVRG